VDHESTLHDVVVVYHISISISIETKHVA